MRRFLPIACFALALLMSGVGAVSPAPVGRIAAGQAARPSLDALLSRAGQYWNLLASRDRLGASGFLRIEDRPRFLEGLHPAFQNPRVETIRLSEDSARAVVETAFDLFVPEIGQVFQRKIQQEWVYIDGEWMAELREPAPNPFRMGPPHPNANALAVGAFASGFHIEEAEIFVPGSASGQIVRGVLHYRYAGASVLNLQLFGAPGALSINRRDLRAIEAGEGEIRYGVRVDLLDETDPGDLVIGIRSGNEETALSILIRWDGPLPYRVVFTPPELVAGYEGTITVEVDNLTDEMWTPGTVAIADPLLELIERPEAVIGNGETARYVFRTRGPLVIGENFGFELHFSPGRILSFHLPYAVPVK